MGLFPTNTAGKKERNDAPSKATIRRQPNKRMRRGAQQSGCCRDQTMPPSPLQRPRQVAL
jgi:hypothetical protein